MKHWIIAGFLAALSIPVLIGCDSGKNAPASNATAELPANLWLDAPPATFVEVADAHRRAKQGDEITVRGRIGGSKQPFVEGRAVFTLADHRLPPCNTNPDDRCEFPWDYCCEPKDRIAAHTLTVRFVDQNGMPLRQSVESIHGLVPLAELIVKGRVSSAQAGSLVVDAAAVHVRRAGTSSPS